MSSVLLHVYRYLSFMNNVVCNNPLRIVYFMHAINLECAPHFNPVDVGGMLFGHWFPPHVPCI